MWLCVMFSSIRLALFCCCVSLCCFTLLFGSDRFVYYIRLVWYVFILFVFVLWVLPSLSLIVFVYVGRSLCHSFRCSLFVYFLCFVLSFCLSFLLSIVLACLLACVLLAFSRSCFLVVVLSRCLSFVRSVCMAVFIVFLSLFQYFVNPSFLHWSLHFVLYWCYVFASLCISSLSLIRRSFFRSVFLSLFSPAFH